MKISQAIHLKKIFKDRKPPPWPIFEKELIDEIIFKTINPRNRIMFESMARVGMRVGTPIEIVSKIILRHVHLHDSEVLRKNQRYRGFERD